MFVRILKMLNTYLAYVTIFKTNKKLGHIIYKNNDNKYLLLTYNNIRTYFELDTKYLFVCLRLSYDVLHYKPIELVRWQMT